VSDDSPHSLSQKERIVRYLRAGNRLTPRAALHLFGCKRLGRDFLGIELSEPYAEMSRKILEQDVTEELWT